MRRSGWFVAGMATAVGVVAAGEVARRRMRGPADELPPAVGYEQAMGPAPAADEPVAEQAEPETDSPYVTVSPLRTPPPPPDRRSDELRTQIAESRRRMHEKAKAGAEGVAGDVGPSEAVDDDEDPTEEH